jgi:Tfp pilus assembly ATPase PilU
MEFEDLLKLMVQKGGSDMFITAGVPPSVKLNGKILPITKTPLSPEMTREVVLGVMTEQQRKEFAQTKECNFRHLGARHRPFPCLGLLPAQSGGHGAAPHRNQHSRRWTT